MPDATKVIPILQSEKTSKITKSCHRKQRKSLPQISNIIDSFRIRKKWQVQRNVIPSFVLSCELCILAPPLSKPSSSTGAPSSSTPPPRTVYAGFEQGPVKGKPSPQTTMGTGKGPSKSSKEDASTLAQDSLFFTLAAQKGKDAAAKGAKKGKNKRQGQGWP